MKRAFPALLASFALACTDPPQSLESPVPEIPPEQIRAHMGFLAHDLLEGRMPGTRGYQIAAEYVATELERMGLEPAGPSGGYFQPVPLRRATIDLDRSAFALVEEGARRPLEPGEDILLTPPFDSDERTFDAPLVFAGFGVSAPELDQDDYAGLDVEGKIVVALSGAPPRFGSTERAFYSSEENKAEAALARGALGLLTIRTPADELRLPWEALRRRYAAPFMRWLDPETGVPTAPSSRLAAVGVLGPGAARALFDGAPSSLDRVLELSESGEVPAFALAREASIVTAGDFEDFESPNVVARLEGSDPALSSDHVVFSAHLDHVGVGEPVDGDAIRNGAYDNASGVAVILAVAEAFARAERPPRRSLLFLAVTAEEQGLLGSDYFAHHPTVPRESIVADVNVDGALMFQPLEDVVPFGADHSTLDDPVSRAAEMLDVEVSPDFMPEEVIFIRSDQYSFVRQGIPSVYPFVGVGTGGEQVLRDWMTTVYHEPTDDMSQDFDLRAGADYARLVYLIGRLVADADERPRFHEGDFLGEKFSEARR